ncbi:MAG: extracellular solute-binding protein [Rhodobacteraceae bacterium]|nr:extracellular solute-binding protein [Paracoccaceae bacterium]
MSILRSALMAGMLAFVASGSWAACAYNNTIPVKSLSAGFEAWKAVTGAMSECGNVEAELDQEFRLKQPDAFAASPALYQIGGVSNSTLVPLLNAKTIRPLDDLIAKHGQNLRQNQLISVDGQIWAIAMMVNAQHLMYRSDILADLGIEVPSTYEELLAAAAKVAEANVVEYPLGGTWKPGFNIGIEFVNLYLGHGGEFFNDDLTPAINNETGVAVLNLLGEMKQYMDPEILVSDSTYVQQQFQQGKIAMANLWATRAAAMDDEAESTVVGKVVMAAAPNGSTRPSSTLWWDGIVIAANISDEEAEAAFQVALEGMDSEMVEANTEVAVWLIDGYVPGRLAAGAAATAANGALPYPASPQMGVMLNSLGNGVPAFVTGDKDAETTLADIEAEYLTKARESGLIE